MRIRLAAISRWFSIFSFFMSQPFFLLLQRSLNPKNFSLQFNPVKLIDNGEYICTINDNPSAPIDLLVQDTPDAPGRPMITGFTSRSVNLSWAQAQDPKNAPVTDFTLETRYAQRHYSPLHDKKDVECRESFIAIHNLPA